ncbi:hypothetical protein C8R46DRAFT_1031836 [Mycena filopes]|nr:hypothetical protein C8R46DRAFT_1031836 [Mycena filopes]
MTQDTAERAEDAPSTPSAPSALTESLPVAEAPSPAVHSGPPWVSGRLFSVVPLSPLAPVADTGETWYAVTKGRYVGVTPVNALDNAATVRVSGAAHKGLHRKCHRRLLPSLTLDPQNLHMNPITPARLSNSHDRSVFRNILVYPNTEGRGRLWALPMNSRYVTLREPHLLDEWLTAAPDDCQICLKPNFKHAGIPGFTFTVLVSCPHHPEIAELGPLVPNKAVARLLPQERERETCHGMLMVIKHGPGATDKVINRDLPVVDMLPADLPFVEELVRRWVVHLYALSRQAASTSSAAPSAPVAASS